MSTEDATIDRLQLSDTDRRKILELMDRAAAVAAAKNGKSDPAADRRSIRLKFDIPNILVDITQPSGSHARFSVPPRNLSGGGLSFIHGQYIYDGTKCSIAIPTLDNEWIYVAAHVIRCNHVSGIVHEVGVKFETPIDLRMFCELSPEQAKRFRAEQAAQEDGGQYNPNAVGEALVVDDFAMDRNLFGMWLKNLGLVPTMASSRTEAVDAISETEFDIILMDMHIGHESGIDVTKILRENGVKSPIVASSAEESQAMQDQALAAGCDAYIVKPFNQEKLRDVIAPLLSFQLQGDGEKVKQEPIVSDLMGDDSMTTLITAFVKSLDETSTQINKARLDNDTDKLIAICRIIKGAGSSYGFDPLSKVAIDTLTAIGDGTEGVTRDVENSLKKLNDILQRIEI